MRAMRRRLRQVRGDAGFSGKSRSAGKAGARAGECLACPADLSDSFDRRSVASEVCLFAIAAIAQTVGPGLVCGPVKNPRTPKPVSPPQSLPLILTRDVALGLSEQLAGLGHILDCFLNQRIAFYVDLAGFCLAENEFNQLGADMGLDEVQIVF